jgi:hypothetical protein
MKTDIERQLRKLKIEDDKITILFVETVVNESSEPGGESIISADEFKIKTKRKPHDNLLATMTKLRKPALRSLEIGVDSKSLPNWDVKEINITGDIILRKCRLTITLSKKVDWSGGTKEIDTPEITLYGDSQFDGHEELAKLAEDVFAEVWMFVSGGYNPNQLALFPMRNQELVEA